MYVRYNDNELVYLSKDGNVPAKEYLFKKYTSLIKKMYREGFHAKRFLMLDFMQEGFLILEKVISSYDFRYKFTFYSYFVICFNRRIYRLLNTGDITLCEQHVKYHCMDMVDSKSNTIRKIIEHSIKEEDELTKKIISECIFENFSINSFCLKYDLNYNDVYSAYRKIRLKLEKILTN